MAKTEGIRADVKAEREMSQWRQEQMKDSRTKTQADVQNARIELGHLEDHSRRIRAKISELEKTIAEIQRSDGRTNQPADDAELAELRRQIAEAERKLAEAKLKSADKKRSYAIVPYEGPNSTHRRPMYIECRADSVVLQPEGIELGVHDFEGPPGPHTPLAAALRAEREYLVSRNGFDPQRDGEPYPLFLVRPDGIIAYYAARHAMKSWGLEFGYEFVDADWKLAYQPPDPQLAQVLDKTVVSARATQERLIAAAPRQYARRAIVPSPGGGSPGGYRPGTGGGGTGQGGAPRGSSGGGSSGGNGEGFGGDEGDELGGWDDFGGRPSNGSPSPQVAAVGNPYATLRGAPGTGVGGVGGVGGTGGGVGGTGGTGGGAGGQLGGSGYGGGNATGNGGAGNGGTGNGVVGGQVGPYPGVGNGAGSGSGGMGTGAGGIGGAGCPTNSIAQGGNGGPGGEQGPILRGANEVGSANPGVGNGEGTSNGMSGGGYPQTNGSVAAVPTGAQGNRVAQASQGGNAYRPAGAYSANSGQVASGQANAQGQGGAVKKAKASDEPPDIFASRVAASQAAKNGTDARNAQTPPPEAMVGQPAPALHPGEWHERPEPPPTLPEAEKNKDKKKKDKIPKYRSQDWALRDAAPRSVPVSRPVTLECQADRLLLMPEKGRGGQPVVAMSAAADSSVDDLVSAVWDRMGQWGMAGRGMYWRPILHVRVAPGGEQRFDDLKALLEGSGLEIVKQ
jgi:hypothetical protein